MFRDGRPIVDEAGAGCRGGATPGNELVRSFGLPGDTEGGVRRLAGADTYPFDVMKVTCAGPDGTRDPVRGEPGQMGLARPGGAAASTDARMARRARAVVRWASGAATSAPTASRSAIAYDTKTLGRRGLPGDRGQRAVRARRAAPVARGRGRATACSMPGLHRAEVRRVHDDAADHAPRRPHPGPQHPELRAKIRFAVERRASDGRRGRRDASSAPRRRRSRWCRSRSCSSCEEDQRRDERGRPWTNG